MWVGQKNEKLCTKSIKILSTSCHYHSPDDKTRGDFFGANYDGG
jgi:hypothetical protein